LQDAGNLGTIFRSAEAFGFQGVLLTEGCCDPFNPKVVRSSMGSLMRVPFVHGKTWEEYQAWFVEKKIRTYALSLEGGEAIEKVRLAPPFAFWIGAEGAGLPTELTDRCDGRIFIPMSGKVESLNAAIAASLAMFWARSGGPVS
jgi:TrmH family RNA methyltransferase